MPKGTTKPLKSGSSQEIELIVKNAESPQKKTFVKELDKLRKLTQKIKTKALLLSQNQKRYKRQTVAQKTGSSQNSKAQRRRRHHLTSQQRHKSSALPLGQLKPQIGLSVSGSKRLKQKILSPAYTSEAKNSSFSSYIPNIDKAQMTALDTDQGSLKFYTFYMRLHEKIRPRWVNRLRQTMAQLSSQEIKKLSRRPQVTSLEVILNAKGEFVGSFVVNRAQKRVLDVAALGAFRQAAPFINPPKEMIEDDGLIYIPFSFRVDLNPNYFARSN